VPASKGRAHLFHLIREILYFQPQHTGTSCARALHFLNNVFPRRAIVFLLSDFIDTGFEKALKVTNQRHDVVAIHISDPGESRLPEAGWVTMEDAETGELVEINTRDPRVRREFEQAATALRDARRRLLGRAGIELIETATNQPYQAVLRKFFEGRTRLRTA
jgi:uncharacterized protein (DUF58 family)